jgi:hypothetical protein
LDTYFKYFRRLPFPNIPNSILECKLEARSGQKKAKLPRPRGKKGQQDLNKCGQDVRITGDMLLGRNLLIAMMTMSLAVIWQTITLKTLAIENSKLTTTPCNFTKLISLKKTENYHIFGGSEFDTLVCGYLFTRQEQIFDERVTVAYLRITTAPDRNFIRAIKRGINKGNSVNFVRNNAYYFNLGCLKKGEIEGTEYDRRYAYLTDRVEKYILQSTPQQPVKLILSFGKHIGSGCECCNLAHRIRLYE